MILGRSKSTTRFEFHLIEFLVSMSSTYLTFFSSLTQSCISCLNYVNDPADACCIAYQIYEQANIIFDETMRQDRLPISMSVASEPLLLPAYIEDCRMKLQDHAFSTYFRGHNFVKKNDDFVGFNGSKLVVRRIVLRYVSNVELLLFNFYNCGLLCNASIFNAKIWGGPTWVFCLK